MSTGEKAMRSEARLESAGGLRRLVSFLRRHRMLRMLNLASPPDVDELSAILEVEKRAGFDGRNNLPPASEEVVAGFQKEVVDFHRKLQSRARDKAEKLAARLLAATRRVDPSRVEDRLRDIPSKCQNEIDRSRAEFDSRLNFLREQEETGQQRQDNGEEQPKESDAVRLATKAISFVLMLAVAGVTALALGSNLIWGIEAGSLLAADAAVAIAAIAIVVPFLIMAGVSNRASMPFDRQRLAPRIAAFLVVVFLGLTSLFCAHLINVSQDATVLAATDVAAAGAAMIADAGAVSANVDALKGLGVVMIMGFLGLLLGTQAVSSDAADSRSHAGHLRICKERQELTRQLRNQINDAVDSAEKEVDRSMNRLDQHFKKLSILVEQANDTQVLYDDFLAGLEESCNLLLERYRETNIAERRTDIPPSFSEQICFRTEGASRKLFFEDSIRHHRESDNEMKDLSDTVAEVRLKLRNLNKQSIQGLEAGETHQEADAAYTSSAVGPVSA